MRFVLGDTETTGLPPGNAAVEIALKEIDESFNELNRWYSLIDPEDVPIHPEAFKIHGISRDMLVDAPTKDEFVEFILGGKLEGDVCLICHNVPFDRPLLSHIGNITHTIDTLEIARALIRNSDNHKLQTLRKYFGIAEDKAHSAMGDVNILHQVLKKLIELSGRSLENHAKTTVRVIHVMPFGRHKGWRLINLPKDYLVHMLGLQNLDPNLRKSMQTILELK